MVRVDDTGWTWLDMSTRPMHRLLGLDPVLTLIVRSRTPVSDDVIELRLVHPDGGPLPPWSPGAHIDLLLGEGLVRQYSLCADPTAGQEWRLGVLLEPHGRGGSAAIHERLQVGTPIRVRGPRNHFTLNQARRYVFVAGGIGITPLIPMIERADRWDSDWILVYGGRSRSSMAFATELVDRYGGRVVLHPEDQEGFLDLPSILSNVDQNTLVYCCGPGGLLDAIESACSGFAPGTLRVERFAPRPQGQPLMQETFKVHLARSGLTLDVDPDHTILEMVDKAGVFVSTSCEEGICGTCETPVLEGLPDHRDSVLTDVQRQSNTSMMICCSRSATPDLVLDL